MRRITSPSVSNTGCSLDVSRLNWHASVGVRAASALDSDGSTIWIANPHCDDGKRFVVRADEKLTAFLELQRAIHEFAVDLIL